MNDGTEQKVEGLVQDIIGSNIFSSLTVAAIIGVATGLGWIVRRVFTNQKQVEILREALHMRDELRKEDRETVLEIKDDVKDLTKTVHTFIARQDARDELTDKNQ